jgi:hypothetical protein
MKLPALAVLVCLICLSGAPSEAESDAPRLVFPDSGFSLAPLEARAEGVSYQALVMLLPPTGGYAPNVDVQIQIYPGDMDDYIAVSRRQIEAAGLASLTVEKLSDESAVFDYVDRDREPHVRFYARAFREGTRYYAVTAGATEEQWDAVGPRLAACVDSFRLEPREGGAGHQVP